MDNKQSQNQTTVKRMNEVLSKKGLDPKITKAVKDRLTEVKTEKPIKK